MKKKKILFYTSGIGLGGVEKVLLELLKFIDKEKYDIKVAFQNGDERYFESEIPKDIQYKFMLDEKIIGKTIYFKERKKKNLIYKICYLFMMKYEKMIIKKEFLKFSEDRDIVIDFKSGDFYKIIQLNKKAKRLCWLHNEITKVSSYYKRKERLEKFFNTCEKVICICNEMKDNLIKEMPSIQNKIEVFYNCFDIQKIEELSKDTFDLNFDDKKKLNDKYFIMVSRLETKMKDFSTLINAYEIYLKKEGEKTLKLYLLGEGPDRDKIEKILKNKGLEEKILLLGAKKNPYPWIKNSKFLIHSSKFEGLPTVLIEALILGKNIISTDCPTGPKEILENGKVGTLVEIGNIQKMANAIEEKVKFEENINKLFESSQRFDGQKIIKNIEKMLEIV